MKSLLEVILLSSDFLEKKGLERPRRSAEEVIADALGKKRLDLYLEFDRLLNEDELAKCRAVIQRRACGEPAAYIAGKVEFAGVMLEVDRSVLIPRPETEILVEKMKGLEGIVWDVCTGSGAIGIALKKRFPHLTVVLSDLDVEVAKKNAELNKVDVEILQGDFLDPFEGACDHLVCNPPYLTEEEYAQTSPELRDFEPKRAFVGGLTFYERLKGELGRVRKKIWLEIGATQGVAVKEIFGSGIVEKDWAGHDRFFSLEL
ncbi:MAG: peptide chain release factor N(5)-glutamine methyltransferase [Chlamydiales bacterium]|nr:peptide chain release factor N(5)-glutamine methyltransferase [Chlamydiales bacterium]